MIVAGISVQRIATRRRSVPAAPATSTAAGPRETRAAGRTAATGATRATDAASPARAATTTARPTRQAERVAADRCGAPVVAVLVDPEGDGCGVTATLDGRRIRTGTGVFEVGSPGDAVALGDWDCDGFATPAVLQPDTSRVFVFDRWPTDGEVSGSASATVAGGRTMRALRSSERPCDRAVVDRDGGPSQVLDLAVVP